MKYQIQKYQSATNSDNQVVSETVEFDTPNDANNWFNRESFRLNSGLPQGYSVCLVPENHQWFVSSQTVSSSSDIPFNPAVGVEAVANGNGSNAKDQMPYAPVPYADIAAYNKAQNQKLRELKLKEELKRQEALNKLLDIK